MENSRFKFRVWDNVDYMSRPFTLQDLQLKKVQFTRDCPIMQFTGLHDKNGAMIFEGDLVKFNTSIRVVEYYKHCFWFIDHKNDYKFPINMIMDETLRGIEVVGDIHSNPELIK